jgi:malate dehydrogenase (oxaloacetate-decarboxylating)(NADP+)
MTEDRKQAALDYHAGSPPGKIAISITKPCSTQADLGLAYTPGVAEPVRAIAANPEEAYRLTAKGNLVAVITDGTAVLGLGNVGPLAGKPVMEGKAVLFKRLAGVDAFDIEVDAATPEEFIDTVTRIAPSFGGINLEDIAAPRCFEIEQALRARLDIPVLHDDQHGTAVIIGAALLNALELQGKTLAKARIVCLGAGAAGIASVRLLIALGARRDNIRLVDRTGVVHDERTDLGVYKREFAVKTAERTLGDAMQGADVFIGVSGPGLLSPAQVASMAPRPIVFALSNPDPEIQPAVAAAVRDDLIMATGRSDYPNQVNNALGFPYLFRGALDVRASSINQNMLIAAVHALAALAHEPVPREVLSACGGLDRLAFGPGYIIPKPLDPRLIERIPPAVAAAAIASGCAHRGYPPSYPKPDGAVLAREGCAAGAEG